MQSEEKLASRVGSWRRRRRQNTSQFGRARLEASSVTGFLFPFYPFSWTWSRVVTQRISKDIHFFSLKMMLVKCLLAIESAERGRSGETRFLCAAGKTSLFAGGVSMRQATGPEVRTGVGVGGFVSDEWCRLHENLTERGSSGYTGRKINRRNGEEEEERTTITHRINNEIQQTHATQEMFVDFS